MVESSQDSVNEKRQEAGLAIKKTLEEGLGVRVNLVDPKLIDGIFEGLIKDEQYLKHFSAVELKAEIGSFVSSLYAIPPKDADDLNKRIEEFGKELEHEKEYTAIFVIDGIYDIPIGTRIGSLEIISPDFSNKNFKDYFEQVIQKHSNNDLKNCVWGKLVYKSYKISNTRDVFFEKAELPFSILTFILRTQIDSKKIFGIITSDTEKSYFLDNFDLGCGWTKYIDHYKPVLSRLSEISLKRHPTELELKIMRSLDIFWLSQLTQKKEIEFLLLISTIESLLLTDNDRDYLGFKLAEKSAFLLETDKGKRIEVYKSIKKLYGFRSGLVHRGERKIDSHQLNLLKSYVYRLLLKIIDLSSKYDNMREKQQPTQKDGVEDFISNLKFERSEIK